MSDENWKSAVAVGGPKASSIISGPKNCVLRVPLNSGEFGELFPGRTINDLISKSFCKTTHSFNYRYLDVDGSRGAWVPSEWVSELGLQEALMRINV